MGVVYAEPGGPGFDPSGRVWALWCGEPTVTLMSSLSAQEADLALCRCEDGVEAALQYTKMWCRYAKDLLAWMEKRITLGEWP